MVDQTSINKEPIIILSHSQKKFLVNNDKGKFDS